MKVLIFIMLIFSFFIVAQDTEKGKTEEQAPVDTEETVQTETQPGEFVYKPMGRRDPFWDLTRGERAKTSREEIEGIAGLLIDELKLEGIVFSKGIYKALFSGPNNEPPFSVIEGTNVYDGVIIKIDVHSVVFKKILTMPLGGKKEKQIIKWLNPEKEGGKK